MKPKSLLKRFSKIYQKRILSVNGNANKTFVFLSNNNNNNHL